jgi:hypothetical protein
MDRRHPVGEVIRRDGRPLPSGWKEFVPCDSYDGSADTFGPWARDSSGNCTGPYRADPVGRTWRLRWRTSRRCADASARCGVAGSTRQTDRRLPTRGSDRPQQPRRPCVPCVALARTIRGAGGTIDGTQVARWRDDVGDDGRRDLEPVRRHGSGTRSGRSRRPADRRIGPDAGRTGSLDGPGSGARVTADGPLTTARFRVAFPDVPLRARSMAG